MSIQSFLDKLNSKFGTWLLFLFCALFVTGLWLPRNWDFYGGGDWDLTYTTFEVARKSFIEFHQWPHFNPYLAFGSDLDANPQANWMSMFFIPVALFGSFYGYKLSILIALLIGLFGMRKLLISIGSETIHSTLLSIFFCSASYFARHIIDSGHSNFINFYLFPYLFYFLNVYRIEHKRIYLLIPILILFQLISGGAPFLFIIASVMLLFWLIGLLITKHIEMKHALMMFSSLLFSIGLSLWKILPILSLWNQHPRLVSDDSQINLLVWLHALNDSSTDTGTAHEWHEITIGASLILPILILAYRQYIPQFKTWALLSILLIWLSLGNQPPFINPWYLVHHYLPIFDGLRAPYRFSFIILFIIVIASGILSKYLKDNKLTLIILISISLSNTLIFNSTSRNLVFTPRLNEITLENQTAYKLINKGINFKNHYLSVKQNQFLISAYEPQHLPAVADTLNQLIDGGQLVKFSPNIFKVKANDTLLRVSIRYSKNWICKEGVEIDNIGGLMAIKSTPNHFYEFKYYNPELDKGIRYSLLSLVFLTLFVIPFKLKKNTSDQ